MCKNSLKIKQICQKIKEPKYAKIFNIKLQILFRHNIKQICFYTAIFLR